MKYLQKQLHPNMTDAAAAIESNTSTNKEMRQIAEQFTDAFEGDPWFGKNAKSLLAATNENEAFEKPSGQHSIVELVWHMINWKEFAISRIKRDETKTLHHFEVNDWRPLNHSDKSLWQQGVNKLYALQNELVTLLQQQQDSLLEQNVFERNYVYKKLLYGALQHDIYHLGQIAYILKLLKGNI